MKVVFPAPLGPMIAATFLGANSPVTPGFTSIYELKWSIEKKESQRKASYSTQVMLGYTSVSSECMLCTLKLVSKYQPSRMHFPLDFNFTPTSSKPTYATRLEWRNGCQPDFSEVHRLKGISNGKPWEIWLQSTHKWLRYGYGSQTWDLPSATLKLAMNLCKR